MEDPQIDYSVDELLSVGEDRGRGNLVGVQPSMSPWDYICEERFYAKLSGYLDIARLQGWLTERTVVVYPEHVGTWLVVAEEHPSVYRAQTIDAAIRAMVLRKPFAFVRMWLSSGRRAPVADKVAYSLFQLKARHSAGIYQSVFSRLAREFRVTVVAGSIVLPAPEVEHGRLQIGAGALYNSSVIYRPDGVAESQVVHKVYPTEQESTFTAPGRLSDLPVFETPAGRLAVLICADAWFPASYETIATRTPDVVVVPSHVGPDGVWATPWAGYSGAPAPGDVDTTDIGRLTEGEARLKYGLAGRLGSSGAAWGICVFLRGGIWDLGSDGPTIILHENKVTQGQRIPGAVLGNLWLN